jgi:glucose/mannose-6-phosphate isomerase
MLELIQKFPEQVSEALEIGKKASFNTAYTSGINNIVICGMGGSGIGGNLFGELLRDNLSVSVCVNRAYQLPAFVNEKTLVILSSYSGNTEETLSAAKAALDKGLKPVCVTSGGKLEELAKANNLDLVKIPGGMPPRACLGYSTVQLFFIAKHYGLTNDSFVAGFESAVKLMKEQQADIEVKSKLLAEQLLNKVIIAYADEKYESVALRFKQQVNENGKAECWYNVFPEINHNELVGWREPAQNLGLLVWRFDDENVRNTHRIKFTLDEIKKKLPNVHEVKASGSNAFEKRFYAIHFGDWLTYHLAILGGYDPIEIDVLIKLKEHMGSIPM